MAEINQDERLKELEKQLDNAYWERNQLVVFLSKRFYAHLQKHDAKDVEWDKAWRNIVCIHVVKGVSSRKGLKQLTDTKFVKDESLHEIQLTWHIHNRELRYFQHLKYKPNHWDGHTTKEKYDRLAQI